MTAGTRPPGRGSAKPGKEGGVKATRMLHERGQSLWLDNITRGMLDAGQIRHDIDNYGHRSYLEPVDLRQGHRVRRL
jgi:hypothetical protein